MEKTENLDKWQSRKFDEFYNEEYNFLQRRLQAGQTTINELKGVLENLYIFDGNNQDGRSLIMQISLNATIAAYEATIAQFEKTK